MKASIYSSTTKKTNTHTYYQCTPSCSHLLNKNEISWDFHTFKGKLKIIILSRKWIKVYHYYFFSLFPISLFEFDYICYTWTLDKILLVLFIDKCKDIEIWLLKWGECTMRNIVLILLLLLLVYFNKDVQKKNKIIMNQYHID